VSQNLGVWQGVRVRGYAAPRGLRTRVLLRGELYKTREAPRCSSSKVRSGHLLINAKSDSPLPCPHRAIHPATDTMPRAPSVFLLLGGVASLPGATLVRYLAKKPASGLSVSRRVDLDADWEWVRLFGSASPAVQAKRPIRAAKPGRFIGP